MKYVESLPPANSHQIDILPFFHPLFLGQLDSYHHIVYHGGRGGGKDWQVAKFLLIRALYGKENIWCFREVKEDLKETSYKIISEKLKEFQSLNGAFRNFEITAKNFINHDNGSTINFHGMRHDTSKGIKSIEGITLAWVNEAQYVSKESIDLLIPTVRKKGSLCIWTYNRNMLYDPVHAQFVQNINGSKIDPKTYVKKVNYLDHLDVNFYLAEAEKLIYEADKSKKENFYEYQHIYLGDPVEEHPLQIIQTEEIRQAMDRTIDNPVGRVQVGCDVAGEGSDRVGVFIRKGLKITDMWETKDPMNGILIADKIIELLGDRHFDLIQYDSTGLTDLGAILEAKGVPRHKINGIHFGSEATEKDRNGKPLYLYANIVTEMYFKMAAMMKELDLPKHEGLLNELKERRYSFIKRRGVNNIKIAENKSDLKERLKCSPDLADALALCLFEPLKKLPYIVIA